MDNIQTLSITDTYAQATPARRLNQDFWALRFTKNLQPMKMVKPRVAEKIQGIYDGRECLWGLSYSMCCHAFSPCTVEPCKTKSETTKIAGCQYILTTLELTVVGKLTMIC